MPTAVIATATNKLRMENCDSEAMSLLRFGPRAIDDLARLAADGGDHQQPQRVGNVREVLDWHVIGVGAHQNAAGSKGEAVGICHRRAEWRCRQIAD